MGSNCCYSWKYVSRVSDGSGNLIVMFTTSPESHTHLDFKQERRIDDYWNIDGSRDLSDSWTDVTQSSLEVRNSHTDICVSGGSLTRRQATSRPDHLWPEHWITMGRSGKLLEKHKWSDEELKLDNARRLWGIYLHDLFKKELKETIENAHKKLETPMAPAMRCKTCEHGESRGKTIDSKSKTCMYLGSQWILENVYGRVFTELSWGPYWRKRWQFTTTFYNLVHKFILVPEAMKNPTAKAAVDKEWENRKGVRRRSSLRFTDGHLALGKQNWRRKLEKCQGRVVHRDDCVKDDFAVFQ